MARLWSSGFELNSTTTDVEFSSIGGSPSIQTSTVRSGTYALQISSLSSGTRKGVGFKSTSSGSGTTIFYRTYFRVDTLPSAENTIMALSNGGSIGTMSAKIYITIDSTGALRLYDEEGAIGSASSALSTSTWHYIEFSYLPQVSANTETIKAQLNGSEFASSTTRDISVGLSVFYVGGNLKSEAQTTGNWFFDDLAINDSTGSFQTSWPGAGSIVHLRPNAAGDNTPASGTYADVDEVTPDDGTTIANMSSGELLDVNLDATPAAINSGDTITCVQVGIRYRDLDDTNIALRIKATSGGTVEESSALTDPGLTYVTNASATPRNYAMTLYDLPGASTTAWTKSDLDTAQIGVNAGTGSPAVSTLWLLVEYVSAGGGTLSVSVSDSTTVSETVGRTLVFNESVSDSTSLTESVNATLVHNASVSDSDSLTESVNRTLVNTIAVSDSAQATDSQTLTATYYFDGSDAAASDPGGVFTNDSNAFDASTATTSTSSTTGSTSSNYLMAEGTTAPTSGGTIQSVRARIYGSVFYDITPPTANAAIYTDALGELLGTPTNSQDIAGYGSYTSLSTPSGGWTWQKLNDLEVKIYKTGGAGAPGISVGMVEFEVTYSAGQLTVSVVSPSSDLSVNVSDSTSISESVQTQPVSFVSVSDSSSVAESVNATLVHTFAVSDSSSLSESSAALLEALVSVSDSSSIAEAVTLLQTSYVTVSDTAALTEALTLLLLAFVAVSDTITTDESVNTTLVHTLAVSDSSSLTDTPALLEESYVGVSDAVGTSEVVQTNPVSFVATSDSISTSEAINQTLTANLSVSDSVGSSETTTATLVHQVNVSDSTSLSENLQLLPIVYVNTSDTVGSSETVTATVAFAISLTDSVSAAESTTLQEISYVTTSDTVTTAEAGTQTLVAFVSVSDTVNSAENTAATLVHTTSISDSTSVSEQVIADERIFVSVSDTIATSEGVSTLSTLYVAVSDNISVAESITTNPVSYVSTSDTINSSESVNPTLVNLPAVSDSVSTAEALSVLDILNISTSQSVSSSDSASAAIVTPAGGDLAVVVSDTIGRVPYGLILVDGRPAIRVAGNFYTMIG